MAEEYKKPLDIDGEHMARIYMHQFNKCEFKWLWDDFNYQKGVKDDPDYGYLKEVADLLKKAEDKISWIIINHNLERLE